MDPITLGIMGLNLVNNMAERKKQRLVNENEAKWSGFTKSYKPQANEGSVFGDVVGAAGDWNVGQNKFDKVLQSKGTGQIDETMAANSFRGPPTEVEQADQEQIQNEQRMRLENKPNMFEMMLKKLGIK